MNFVDALRHLAITKPDTHWYAPDGNGFIKAIPKEMYTSEGGSSIHPRDQIDITAYNAHQFVVNNPGIFFGDVKTLDLFLSVQINITPLPQDDSTNVSPFVIARNIIKVTTSKAILALIGTDSAEISDSENKEKTLEKLNELRIKLSPEGQWTIDWFCKRVKGTQVLDMDLPTEQERELIRRILTKDPDYAKVLEGVDKATVYRVIRYLVEGNVHFNGFVLVAAAFKDFDLEEFETLLRKIPHFDYGIKAISRFLCYFVEHQIIGIPQFLEVIKKHLGPEERKQVLSPHSGISGDTITSLYRNGMDEELFFDFLTKVPAFYAYLLLEALNSSTLHKRYAMYTDEHFQSGPIDSCFPIRFDTSDVNKETLKKWRPRGAIISQWTVIKMFRSRRYESILLILKLLKPADIEDYSKAFLISLMSLRDDRIANLTLARSPILRSKCSFETISEAVSDGNSWFVTWVTKDTEFKITTEEVEKLIAFGLLTKNLRIIKCLDRWSGKNDYPKNLGIDEIIDDDKKLLERITQYAIVSPLPDLYELLECYPQIVKILPEALESAALVVRFPCRSFLKEFDKEIESTEDYLKKSLAYARENLNFIAQVFPSVKEMSREELLNATINDRYKRFERLPKDQQPKALEWYLQRQKDKPVEMRTPLHRWPAGSSNNSQENIGILKGSFNANRYTHSLKHFAQYAFDWEAHTWNSNTGYRSVVRSENEYIFHYDYGNGVNDEPKVTQYIETTHLKMDRWIHTSSESINQLEEHRDKLHREIFDFVLDRTDAQSRKQFFRKVAVYHWLNCTLCEIVRGTPHNTMINLNLIYKHHRLPPPIPLQDHYFLDNTMLMIPCERAVEMWETFFEPTLDKCVSPELLQQLIAINDKVRDL